MRPALRQFLFASSVARVLPMLGTYQDTFNRPDSATIGTASDAATAPDAGVYFAEQDGSLAIASNRLVTTDFLLHKVSRNIGSGNGYMRCKINTTTYGALTFRDNGAGNFVRLYVDPRNQRIQLTVVQNYGDGAITIVPQALAIGADNLIEIAFQGATVNVICNGGTPVVFNGMVALLGNTRVGLHHCRAPASYGDFYCTSDVPFVKPPLSAGLAQMKGWGANLSVNRSYNQQFPFRNLIRVCDYWQDYAHIDAFDWPVNVPTGYGTSIIVWRLTFFDYVMPGDYVVASTTGARMTVSGGGLTNIVQGTDAVPQASFTVAAGTDPRTINLEVGFFNGTGATIASLASMYVGLASSYAGYRDNGDIYDPAFLANLAGVRSIRFNDWLGRNGGGSEDLAYRPVEANRRWGTGYTQGQLPWTAMAKLCKTLNCGVWFSTPVGNEGFFYVMSDTATGIFTNLKYIDGSESAGRGTGMFSNPHGMVENQEVLMYTFPMTGLPNGGLPPPFQPLTFYYAHIIDAGRYQLKGSVGGSIIMPTQTANVSYSTAPDYSCGMVKTFDPQNDFNAFVDAIFSVYPLAPMILGEVSNEAWNGSYQRGFFTNIAWPMAFRGQTSTFQLIEGARGYAFFQMKLWKAIELKYPRAINVRALMGQNGFFNNMSGMWDMVDTWGILQSGAKVSELADGYAIANYKGVDYAFDGMKAVGLENYTDAQMLVATDTAAETGYAAAKDTVDALAAVSPYLTPLSYEDGWANYFSYNYQSAAEQALPPAYIAQVGARMHAFLKSPAAATYGTRYMQRALKDAGLINTQHWFGGNWAETGTGFSAYGMKQFSNAPDTPLATAIRTFNWY